jgi:hypothetical protein
LQGIKSLAIRKEEKKCIKIGCSAPKFTPFSATVRSACFCQDGKFKSMISSSIEAFETAKNNPEAKENEQLWNVSYFILQKRMLDQFLQCIARC